MDTTFRRYLNIPKWLGYGQDWGSIRRSSRNRGSLPALGFKQLHIREEVVIVEVSDRRVL